MEGDGVIVKYGIRERFILRSMEYGVPTKKSDIDERTKQLSLLEVGVDKRTMHFVRHTATLELPSCCIRYAPSFYSRPGSYDEVYWNFDNYLVLKRLIAKGRIARVSRGTYMKLEREG